MTSVSKSISRRLGIIWAITSKDLLDAIKNKTTLAVLIPVLFILVFYRYVPQIYGHDDLLTVHLYDPTNSDVAIILEESIDLDVREVDSQDEVKQSVSNSDVPEVGLVFPADFNLEGTTPLELDAYMIYWLTEAERFETTEIVTQELSFLLERPVKLLVEGEIYHEVDSEGLGFLASISIIFAIVMIGISFLPNLMLEEQREETIKLLRVSPASALDIVLSKAFTGLTYALLTSAIAWLLYRPIFINPVMTAITFLAGSMLFVLVGLLLGGLVKNRQQLMMVGWVIILPLILPPFMEMMDDILPSGLLRVIRFIPSVSLARMLRSGLTARPDWGFYLGQLAYLTTFIVILFGFNVVNVRRREH